MKRLATLLLVLGAACGDAKKEPLPSDGGLPANVAGRGDRAAPKIPDDAPTVAFLGDSLAAGLHLAKDEAFPAVLQRRLARRGHPFKLVNAGVSGSTTAAGLARSEWIMKQKPAIVVVELGANDGFRGVPLKTIRANLEAILANVRKAGAKPLLLGIRLPPNYGKPYTDGFHAIFAEVARESGAAYVPGFMAGVGGVKEMNLKDGIHPTPEGHERLADNVEAALVKLLEQRR